MENDPSFLSTCFTLLCSPVGGKRFFCVGLLWVHLLQLMWKSQWACYMIVVIVSTHWGVDILSLLCPASSVRRHTWFPDILGNSSYPIFTKFGMQVYWVNSLYGIAFGDDSSIAN